MLLKLAVRNMRRSLRDYAIYFVTLLIAVTVFYAFNSVGDQQVMHDIAASNNANVIEFTGYMMNIFSVIVALVLGFLVIYANQLLITRRKREFGIYLVLGMRPGQVSRILLYETVFIGLGSLVLGLGLGIVDKIAGQQHCIRGTGQIQHTDHKFIAVGHNPFVGGVQLGDADMAFGESGRTLRHFWLDIGGGGQESGHRLGGGHGEVHDACARADGGQHVLGAGRAQ